MYGQEPQRSSSAIFYVVVVDVVASCLLRTAARINLSACRRRLWAVDCHTEQDRRHIVKRLINGADIKRVSLGRPGGWTGNGRGPFRTKTPPASHASPQQICLDRTKSPTGKSWQPKSNSLFCLDGWGAFCPGGILCPTPCPPEPSGNAAQTLMYDLDLSHRIVIIIIISSSSSIGRSVTSSVSIATLRQWDLAQCANEDVVYGRIGGERRAPDLLIYSLHVTRGRKTNVLETLFECFCL